jgi:hypothetical protein
MVSAAGLSVQDGNPCRARVGGSANHFLSFLRPPGREEKPAPPRGPDEGNHTVINTGIYCSDGGTVSLTGVAIGANATVVVSGDEQPVETADNTDDQE